MAFVDSYWSQSVGARLSNTSVMTVILLSRSPLTLPTDGESTESLCRNDSPHLTIQMLPTALSRGVRPVFAAIPITSQVDTGPMKTIRTGGKVPGAPTTFVFPTIVNPTGEERSSSKFGFLGYLELVEGTRAGTFSKIGASCPTLKMVGKGMYFQTNHENIFASPLSATPTASVGAEWAGLTLARSSLITNTDAFFRAPAFEAAIRAAASDHTFDGIGSPRFSVTKMRGTGLQCVDAAQSRQFSPTMSRYVIITNPPPDSRFGAAVVAVTGGGTNERGATRPYKLSLCRADGSSNTQQVVTLWPSDLPAEVVSASGVDSTLRSDNLILLISGTPSEMPRGVEYVVRALASASLIIPPAPPLPERSGKRPHAKIETMLDADASYDAICQCVLRNVDSLASRCWVGMPVPLV